VQHPSVANTSGRPTISVVVPAYNEEASIAACLRSLADQEVDAPYEVILVDNNSTDNTVEVARAASGQLNLRIVHEQRQGRGAARCGGFAAAEGDIVFSADADAVYPPHWLRAFRAALADGTVVGVSGPCRIADLAPWKNLVFNLAQPCVMWFYRLTQGHHCLSGFSLAIRREAYVAAGGFDPALNAQEDADLSRRVARLGRIRFIWVPITFSGRRFKRGLVHGLMDYVRLFFSYRASKTSATLSDIR
jgi:glycosyltransferase involved in cell wall biosynthesis